MNTQDENMDVVHKSAYDPFPMPQTIPSGWDLSELLSVPRPSDLAQGKSAPIEQEDDLAER